MTKPVTPSPRLISGIFEARMAQKDGVSKKIDCNIRPTLYELRGLR